MSSPSPFDCLQCGACCFAGHDRYVVLLPEDRGRAIPENATHTVVDKRYMRMSGGHCAQLCRTPEATLVCGLYDTRPEACRAFRAGSFECLRARARRLPEAEAMRLPPILPPDPPIPPDPPPSLPLSWLPDRAENKNPVAP